MSIFEDTNPKALKTLLLQIHQNDAVLPDFQRDFVWEPSATKELIVSILQNYPAGSLLRIQYAKDLFAIRSFAGADSIPLNHSPNFLVLDGQQRLTSLFQAFYGTGEYRYYLNVGKILGDPDGDSLEECVFYLKHNHPMALVYKDIDVQARDLILPLGILKGTDDGFDGWVRRVRLKATTFQEGNELEEKIYNAIKPIVKVLDDYHFPVVTLTAKTTPEAVCNIFETLNRTGVKLSPFELLVARFYPRKVYLRQLWDKAIQDYPIIEDFEIDPYYVMQIITLAASKTPTSKRSDVLNLTYNVVDSWWDKAIKGLAATLCILRDECGILHPGWLPYNTIVNPMAAVLAKQDFQPDNVPVTIRQKLKRWFWCSVFLQTYESSPTSQAASDVTQLQDWFNIGNVPEVVANFADRFVPASLRTTTFRQRAVFRGVQALILSKGVLDFETGAKITSDLMITKKIDGFPVFPVAYLKNQNIKGEKVDNVLNVAFFARDYYKDKVIPSKGPQAPTDYLYQIELEYNKQGSQHFVNLMNGHLLPAGGDSPLRSNDYEAFLDWRLNAIWRAIRQVTSDQPDQLPDVPIFPNVSRIESDNLREQVEHAVSMLNVEYVDMGLFALGGSFERSLKRYLEAYQQVNSGAKLPNLPGQNSDSWTFFNMINSAVSLNIVEDGSKLHYLRQERNERAHGQPPSQSERQNMMSGIETIANSYIDTIKHFDDLYHKLP